jgi:uncharacterized protein (TIGR03643 family)
MQDITPQEIDRVIEMAWEDRTPFDAIYFQFGLTEQEVIRLMKLQMTPRNWRKWRERVQGRRTKHARLRQESVRRFKSTRQRGISQNRVSKRK